MATAPQIEAQFGSIVPTRIFNSSLPPGVKSGYDKNSHTYRIPVLFNANQRVLGYTHKETVSLGHATLDNYLGTVAPGGTTETQLQFLSANILMHEVVHAIEHRAWFRSGLEHESEGGLMTGPPWDASGFSFTAGSSGLIPFSNTTTDRLRVAIGAKP